MEQNNINPRKQLTDYSPKAKKILWKNNPSIAPIALQSIVALLPMMAVVIILQQRSLAQLKKDGQLLVTLCLITSLWLFVRLLLQTLSQLRTQYVVTNKRIIYISGIWQSQYQSIYYNKIQAIHLAQTIPQQLCNLHTIFIDDGMLVAYNAIEEGTKITTVTKQEKGKMVLESIEQEKLPKVKKVKSKFYHQLENIPAVNLYRLLQN